MWISPDSPPERSNAKIKRLADVWRIFPNEAATIQVVVGALLLGQNRRWQLQRFGPQLEGLRTRKQSVCDALGNKEVRTRPELTRTAPRTPADGASHQIDVRQTAALG